MEIKYVYVKTRAEFGKQCTFDVCGPNLDEEIRPNPQEMNDYTEKDPYHRGVQHTKQLAVHEAQTLGVTSKSSSMFHYEGGWPKEINPRDEEATTRFRRRVEKDDEWGPKMLNLFQIMERNVLQNSAVDIHRHYFDDMLPSELVKRRALRTVNAYTDPEQPCRPVSSISWSPDFGHRLAVSYSFMQFETASDYSNKVHIWQLDNPNVPSCSLEAFCPTVVTEFNPRDPSVLASGLMSGQVCNWDVRTGIAPVQISHRQFSHRCSVNAIKWIYSKTNTEFYTSSSEGRAMWWDTRFLRRPTEILVFDFGDPNNPRLDNAVGISSMDRGPGVGTKFMFGMENGLVINGSRKAKTFAEKMALRFNAHYGPVVAVDRNSFNPKVFLTIGDWSAKIWAEDTREDSLLVTRFLASQSTGGCWNKLRYSVFYMITHDGYLEAWDILEGLSEPILRIHICEERLTVISAHEENGLLAIGSYDGRVYLVQTNEALMMFDKVDRNNLSAYVERCSKYSKAIDTRMKEMKVSRSIMLPVEQDLVKKSARGTKKGKDAERKVTKEKQEKREAIERQKLDKAEREKYEKQVASSADKSRSLSRDKRRMKDETSEFLEHEEKYFAIVDKEKENYELDEVQFKTSTHWLESTKRPDSRKDAKVNDTSLAPEETQRSLRSKRSNVKTKTSALRRSIDGKPVDEIPNIVEMTAGTENLSQGRRKSRRKRSKVRLQQRKSSVVERSKPCKKICKPKVCCPDEEIGTISREEKEMLRCRASKADKSPMSTELTGDKRDSRQKEGEISSPERSRQRGDSTYRISSLPAKKEQKETKRTPEEKLRIVREMLAPPTEIAEEAAKARKAAKELWKHLYKATSKTLIRTKSTKRGHEARTKRSTGKRRGGSTKKDKLRETGRENKITEDLVAESSELSAASEKRRPTDSADKKKRRIPKALDPCSPITPASIAKGIQRPSKSSESIETHEKVKKLDDRNESPRLYPRISEFHTTG